MKLAILTNKQVFVLDLIIELELSRLIVLQLSNRGLDLLRARLKVYLHLLRDSLVITCLASFQTPG